MTLLLQLLVNGLVNAAVYAMLAVGFGIVWRSLRVFHIAYGGLFLLCAYCFWGFAEVAGLPPAGAAALTLLCAVILGWGLGRGLYLPFHLRGASSESTLIASLGISIAIQNALAMAFGSELKIVSQARLPQFQLGQIVLSSIQVWELICGVTILSIMALLIWKVKLFKSVWALGDQPDLAPALGLPVFLLRDVAMISSTVLAAIPACLICLDSGITPQAGMSYVLIAATAPLIGGVSSMRGWILGSLVLSTLQTVVIWRWSARWMDLAVFALLIGMLLVRPRGLLETRRRVEELA